MHHSWINQMCIILVAAKCIAEGTAEFHQKQLECSQGLFREYRKNIERIRKKLLKARAGTKRWWKISHTLLNRPETTNTIPALRRRDRTWARAPDGKAELLRENFMTNWTLPNTTFNEFFEYPY